MRAGTDAGDDISPAPPGDMDKASLGDAEGIKEEDGDVDIKVVELVPPAPEVVEGVASYVRGDWGTAKVMVLVLAAVLTLAASKLEFKAVSVVEEDANVPSRLNKAVSST